MLFLKLHLKPVCEVLTKETAGISENTSIRFVPRQSEDLLKEAWEQNGACNYQIYRLSPDPS